MLTLHQLSVLTEPQIVTIGGIQVLLRRLSARERFLARKAHPEPRPPERKDPSSGSASPRILIDDEDPGFKAAYQQWMIARSAADLAIASNYQTKAGITCPDIATTPEEQVLAWVRTASDELLGAVPVGILDAFSGRIHGFDLTGHEKMTETARGN